MEAPLISYAGTVERPPALFERSGQQPWPWHVTVTELLLPGYGKRFEVRVTRHGGPKLSGTPDPVGVTIAQVDDVISEPNGEAAREIAMRAADALSSTWIPDLKQLQILVVGDRRAGEL